MGIRLLGVGDSIILSFAPLPAPYPYPYPYNPI
jgi:hypothetical protein